MGWRLDQLFATSTPMKWVPSLAHQTKTIKINEQSIRRIAMTSVCGLVMSIYSVCAPVWPCASVRLSACCTRLNYSKLSFIKAVRDINSNPRELAQLGDTDQPKPGSPMKTLLQFSALFFCTRHHDTCIHACYICITNFPNFRAGQFLNLHT